MQAADLLKALEAEHRLQGETPCAAVQALEATLASLQQLQADLKNTKEYRAAQAEQRRLSESDRARQLAETVARSRAAAEALLGYPLTPQHFETADVYALMPTGYVDGPTFDAYVQQFQARLAALEEALDKARGELDELKSPDVKPASFGRNFDIKQRLEQKKGDLRQAELQVHHLRSRLLGYLATHQPMRDAAFGATLASHLDAMLAAYLALHAPSGAP